MNKLSEYVEFKNGKKRPNQYGEYPVYGGNGILDYANQYNLDGGVIIGRVGVYCGNVFIENSKCWVSDNAISAQNKANLNRDYLYYLLKSLKLNERRIGTSQPLLTQNILNNIEVNIPDLDYQMNVAGILRSLDQKIKLNNAINKNLFAQVMALYKHFFTESVAEHNSCRADEYFDITIGKTPPRKEREWFSTNQKDERWVSISDMGNCGLYISNTSERLTHDAIRRFNIVIVPDNTVLLSFKLTVGRLAITDGEMVTNEAIAHFKTDNAYINPYLFCYLKSFNFQSLGSTSSIATAVNSKIIKAMPFVIPEAGELQQFNEVALPAFAAIKANQAENRSLSELRDSLLPKLMSGELDVSNIDL